MYVQRPLLVLSELEEAVWVAPALAVRIVAAPGCDGGLVPRHIRAHSAAVLAGAPLMDVLLAGPPLVLRHARRLLPRLHHRLLRADELVLAARDRIRQRLVPRRVLRLVLAQRHRGQHVHDVVVGELQLGEALLLHTSCSAPAHGHF